MNRSGEVAALRQRRNGRQNRILRRLRRQKKKFLFSVELRRRATDDVFRSQQLLHRIRIILY